MGSRERVTDWVLAHDPGGAALRKAAKAAVVVPIGVAVGLAWGQVSFSTFAAFGGIALLLFTDFPGDRRARLGSYLLLTALGVVFITAGTLASSVGWLAVATMFVVGFAVLFCGVFSAAIDGAGRAALLVYILPVCLVAPPSDIGVRIIGWLFAAALAVPAAVFLWPPRQHADLRHAAAEACREIGTRIERLADPARPPGPDPDDTSTGGAAEDTAAVARLREQFRQSSSRPTALTTGSRLLGSLIDRLSWLHTVVTAFPAAPVPASRPPWVVDLQRRCGDVLLAAADALAAAADGSGPVDGAAARAALDRAITGLEEARRNAAESRELLALAVRTTQRAPALMHELTYTTLLAGHTVAAAARADARTTLQRILGRANPPASLTRAEAAGRLARGHLTRHSVWFQNSVRGGLGLALAVLMAEVTQVSHGFWVVLGAMSVLRTTALNTGATAVRALGGTFLGFVVGALVMLLVGGQPVVLWLLLPLAVFVAACLPAMVSFVAGQAAFTVLVVVLFNIISPVGWSIGLLRVEDVLIGAGAAVACALLWPRGAAGELRQSLADAARTAGDSLVAAVDALVTTDEAPESAGLVRSGALLVTPRTSVQNTAIAAAARLDDALRQYLTDRGHRPLPTRQATLFANAVIRVRLAAGAILAGSLHPGVRPLPDALRPVWRRLRLQAQDLDDWFAEWADDLAGSGDGLTTAVPSRAERIVLSAVRRDPGVLDDPELSRPICALWWTALYLDDAARLQDRLRQVAPGTEPVVSPGGSVRPTVRSR